MKSVNMTWKNAVRTELVYVKWIWTFIVRRCVPINEIEIGIWDEIERLSSWREIEWQLRVVKLNEYPSKLNEIKFIRNDTKRNWMLKEWKWTVRTESLGKSIELERLFMNLNANLMKLGGKTYNTNNDYINNPISTWIFLSGLPNTM